MITQSHHNRGWLEPQDGERLQLDVTLSIGRSSDNGLVLKDERVSRRHALIHMQGEGEWWLVDLGSSNGTYINRVRVSQPIRLRDGDQVEFGPFQYVFRQGHSPPAMSDRDVTTERTVVDLRTAACWLLVADVEGLDRIEPGSRRSGTGRHDGPLVLCLPATRRA